MNTANHTNTPLRIGIDGNEANVSSRVGSNAYAFEIITALDPLCRKQGVEVTVFLTQPPLPDLPPERAGWRYVIIAPNKFATQFALPLALFRRKNALDVFFSPGHYAPRLCPIPYISSVMDLAFLEYPEQFRKSDLYQLTAWTKYSVQHAARIVSISEATKHAVHKQYAIPKENIVVAYPAADQPLMLTQQQVQETLHTFQLKKPFILYVGTIQPRKNLVRLIEAFELIKHRIAKGRVFDQLPDAEHLQLVIAGKIGWLAGDVQRAAERSPVADDIRLIGYVTDEQKHALYQAATCSTLVGLLEGFGMPPLESLMHGTPVVVSKTSSLPEVVGEAGILVNPESVSSIARGLEKALKMNAHDKAAFAKNAKRQVDHFAWTRSATIILDTLHDVHQERLGK